MTASSSIRRSSGADRTARRGGWRKSSRRCLADCAALLREERPGRFLIATVYAVRLSFLALAQTAQQSSSGGEWQHRRNGAAARRRRARTADGDLRALAELTLTSLIPAERSESRNPGPLAHIFNSWVPGLRRAMRVSARNEASGCYIRKNGLRHLQIRRVSTSFECQVPLRADPLAPRASFLCGARLHFRHHALRIGAAHRHFVAAFEHGHQAPVGVAAHAP